MTDAEGNVMFPLQGFGQFHRRRPVVLELLERTLRIDLERVQNDIEIPEHVDGVGEQADLGPRRLVVGHSRGHVVRAERHGVGQPHDIGGFLAGAAPTLAACWLHSAVVAQGNWPVSAALAMPGMQAIESIRAVIFDFIWVSSFPVPGAIEVRTETGADCSFCLGGTASRGQSDRRRSF